MLSRILNHFQLAYSGPAIIIYGGYSESFILPNFRWVSINELLWTWLKKEKFERLLYYDTKNGLYTYDIESLNIGDYNQPDTTSFNELNGWQDSGEWNIETQTEPTSNTPSVNYWLNQGSYKTDLYELAALEVINTLIETGSKTAIIFPAFTSTFTAENDGSLRDKFNATFANWFTTKTNCKLFLNFLGNEQTNCFDFIERYGYTSLLGVFKIKNIDNNRIFRLRQNHHIKVGFPKIDEINTLLNKERLLKNKTFEFENKKNILRGLAFNKISLQNLSKIIENAPALNVKLLNSVLADYYENEPKELNRISDSNKSALDELNSFIGLDKVKEKVRRLIAVSKNKELGQVKFHMVFTGSTGTGKTEVAKIVAKIFEEENIIEDCGFTYATPQTLLGQYVGLTAIKTGEVCTAAAPGVLLIDEAYGITDNEFGKECITELITHMLENRGNLCVILAGYQHDINKLYELNEGLKNRISQKNIIPFPDYSNEELCQIFELKLSKSTLNLSDDLKAHIRKYIAYRMQQNSKDFGNARGIENIIETLIELYSESRSLSIKDIEREFSLPASFNFTIEKVNTSGMKNSALEQLEKMRGIESLIGEFKTLISLAKSKKRRGLEMGRMHMAFLGNPGTGKTTVAKLMGSVFKEEGILSSGHVVAADAVEIMKGYVGQVTVALKKKCDEAMGGVLFIDEAYNLASNQFGVDAINQVLVKYLEDYKDKFVVIVAGYTNVMNKFFDENIGLKSRIDNLMNFEDYSPEVLTQIFENKVKEFGLVLESSVLPTTKQIIENVYQNRGKDFGNARWVENFLQAIEARWSIRTESLTGSEPIIEADIPKKYLSNLKKEEVILQPLELTIEDEYEANVHLPAYLDNCVGLISAGEGTGTGFVVTKDAHIITCYHVIEGANEVTFKTDKMHEPVSASICYSNPEKDFAVLQLTQIPASLGVCSLINNFEHIPPLSQLIHKSYPLGNEVNNRITTYSGEVNGEREIKGFKAIQTNLNITHGSSGGPVFRKEDHKVIGYVVVGMHSERTRGASFVFVWDIRQLFDDKNLNVLISRE